MQWIQTLLINPGVGTNAPVAVKADLHGSFRHFNAMDFSMYSYALFEFSAPGADARIATVIVLFPEATLPPCPASKNLPV
jgi:hypothetical protein